MDYRSYREKMSDIPVTDALQYVRISRWFHPEMFVLEAASLGNEKVNAVRIPGYVRYKSGKNVCVTGITKKLFFNNEDVTDIMLPPGIAEFPDYAFSGCKNLKNITIPKKVTTIREGTFEGCDSLSNVYYEGSMEEWKKITILHERYEVEFGELIQGTPVWKVASERLKFVPGNEALFMSDIHFNCELDNETTYFRDSFDGKDMDCGAGFGGPVGCICLQTGEEFYQR